MSDASQEKPKIIIDEDWKSRVEAEREELKQKAEAAPSSESDARPEEPIELPPPTFSLLVTTLATQAMAALGQLSDPNEKGPVISIPYAKHHIDMLEVLQEKTKGNLTPDEAAMVDNVLHQLRMMYVSVQSGMAAKPPETGS